MVGRKKVFAFNFQDPASGAPSYWRISGCWTPTSRPTRISLGATPTFDLFDPEWPIRSRPQLLPPSKFVTNGMPVAVEDSLIASGCIIEGTVTRSILSPGVRVGPEAVVEDAILWDGVDRPPGQGEAGDYRRGGAGAAGLFHRLRPPMGRLPLPPHRRRHRSGRRQRHHGGLGAREFHGCGRRGFPHPTRVYLVRHGQVADGHTDRYHGNNDIGLSDKGVRQFEELAAQLSGVPLAGIYASDLTRALTGAQIISRGRDLAPQIIPEFREIHFGAWEGLSFTEIAERYPRRTRGPLPGPHQLPHSRRKPPGRELPGPTPSQ